MRAVRNLAFGIAAVAAAAAGMLVIGIEQDLKERRHQLVDSNVYWQCDRAPADAVLARVYAGRLIAEHRPSWTSGMRWVLGYAAYTGYLRLRLGHDELMDAFLRTPSNRESGCRQELVGVK